MLLVSVSKITLNKSAQNQAKDSKTIFESNKINEPKQYAKIGLCHLCNTCKTVCQNRLMPHMLIHVKQYAKILCHLCLYM